MVFASQLENGTYAVDYNVYQADSDSVSIANDYFLKPAILTVEDDEWRIQLTVNQSEWVKALRVADGDSYKDVEVVSENIANNTRDVAFMVIDDIAAPVYMQMNIRIESMTPVYDHQYTVRYIFDATTAEAIETPPQIDQPQEQEDDAAEGMKLIAYAVVVLLLVIVIIIFFNKRQKKKLN